MESDPRADLQALERAEAAPYLRYPPTRWWHYPAVGLWTAALIGSFVWFHDNPPLSTAAVVALFFLEVLAIRWFQRRHGAIPMPGHGRPPTEIAPVLRGYYVGLGVVAVAAGIVWWLLGPLVAAAVAFVLVTGGLFLYDDRYERAAVRARARLA